MEIHVTCPKGHTDEGTLSLSYASAEDRVFMRLECHECNMYWEDHWFKINEGRSGPLEKG